MEDPKTTKWLLLFCRALYSPSNFYFTRVEKEKERKPRSNKAKESLFNKQRLEGSSAFEDFDWLTDAISR
jgi:hypothetical protein